MVGSIDESDGKATGYRWSFLNVVLDERRRELLVGNEHVDIESRVFDAIVFLLRHAGEVVTKDELLDGVWPGRVLTDSAVAKCVSRAREALNDKDQTIIKTIRGYGYQLIAEVNVKEISAANASELNLKVGDHPPLRPYWSLKERLGVGGQGEVWLVRHDKTGELRVLKFALDAKNLVSLKREITLSRYLHDALGQSDEFLPVIDWNLQEVPYFLESHYVVSGNLERWAQTQGGLAAIPLHKRLEVAAQIAEALAHAHSVGVLHKDVKPSNVLIEANGQHAPAIRLVDFGSAGIFDVTFLEKLGITRLGFTKTVQEGAFGTTALYLAPEVMAGQQFTIQSDIYALGVVLFQLVVGDLEHPPGHGWESRVQDSLIREDLALAMAGEPKDRLRDAGELASRIRNLESRRQELVDAAEARRREEQKREEEERKRRQAELAAERAQARRSWMLVALAVSIIGFVTSTTLYIQAERDQERAAQSAAVSQAVADFLSNDMFAEITDRPLRGLKAEELLNAAAAKLDTKFSAMPAAETKLHAALGRAYWKMEMAQPAKTHLEKALEGFRKSGETESNEFVLAATDLVRVAAALGEYDQANRIYEFAGSVGVQIDRNVSFTSPELQLEHAWLLFGKGDWLSCVAAFRELIRAEQSKPAPKKIILGQAQLRLGHVLTKLGQYDEAESLLRSAKSILATPKSTFSLEVATTQVYLGQVLMEKGELSDAREELVQAREVFRNWTSEDASVMQGSAEILLARVSSKEGNVQSAIGEMKRILRSVESWNYIAEAHSWLAAAYKQAGEYAFAEESASKALELALETDGLDHPLSQGILVELASIARRTKGVAAAIETLDAVNESRLKSFGAAYPVLLAYNELKHDIAKTQQNIRPSR